jgi:hypothetical protein
MTTVQNTDPATKLRQWADGSHACEAAVQIITGYRDGQFIGAFQAWVSDHDEDAQLVADHAAYASGGEQVLLTFAQALVVPTHVDLSDIARVDRATQQLIIDAIRHAGGLS